MDSDPFAVWDDPAPVSASSSSGARTETAATISDDQTIKDNVRLSIEYEDEDPGWGAPSGSASRATSPEKSRKQSSLSTTGTAIPPTPQSDAGEANNLTTAQNGEEHQHTPATDAIEQDISSASATAGVEAVASDVAELEKIEVAAQTATPQSETGADDEEDEGMDAFEDSQQEQGNPAEDGVPLDDFDQKATSAAAPVDASQDDDGFDDFDEPTAGGAVTGTNDDFGDFDDFETGGAQDDAGFGDDDFDDDSFDQPAVPIAQAAPAEPTPAPVAARTWSTLEVTSRSNRIDLADSVKSLLPLATAAEEHLSNVGLRQVEGPSQVLVSGESRQLWIDLTSFPSMQPIDWVRSKTRRDYLISMGVPVNLDEIHSSFASGSGGSRQMPTLQLKYESQNDRTPGSSGSNGSLPQRSSSLKLTGNGSSAQAAQRSASTSNSPRNGNSSPALGSSTNRERMAERRMQELGLGPAPQVDLRRAQELISKTEDELTLLSLPALKSMRRELNTLTTSASSLLTHHLTLRESYQADSEMYNSMIKELVTGAASRFSGGGSGSGSSGGSNSVAGGRGDSRRSTTMGMSASSSGKARVASLPAGSTAMAGTRSMSPSMRGGAGASPRR